MTLPTGQAGLQGQARHRYFVWTSAVGVLLLGVALVFLNVISNWVYARFDLTRHHTYSLSPSSKKLVRGLEDLVVIKAYFTPELPAPYNLYGRYVKDILAEYRTASHGKVRYEFVATRPQQDFEQHALESGLTPIQFEEMGHGQFQVRRGFMGLVIFYRDRTETLPVIKSVESLEYDLTSRLARMTRTHKKRIALLTGHGEANWQTSEMKLAQDLSQLYDIQPVTLTPKTTAPLDADALLVVGPTQKYDEASLWAVDQAIMRGIPAAFLIDSKRFLIQQFMVMPQATGLEDLVKHYGAEISDQVVYDDQCETIGMTQNLGGLALTTSVHYRYVLLVTHMNKKHPLLQGIDTVGIPFATKITTAKLPPGVVFTSLLESSDKSWLAPASIYTVAPNAIPQPAPHELHGPFVVGGLLEGTFPSYYSSRPSPLKNQTPVPVSPKTSLFILSTSHILDPNLPEFAGVEALMTNAIGYLTHDETLIGIRTKGNILRPLKPILPATRQAIIFLCVLGVPVLPILWGLILWRRRQAWRRTLAAGFVGANHVATNS